MRITYDAKADAVYIYLSQKVEKPETRLVDDDILLDFDEQDRIVGIEVLGASKRLDLSSLMPIIERIDMGWGKLRRELLRRQKAGEPVKTLDQGVRNWVEEVGPDYVVLRSERARSGGTRMITASKIEEYDRSERYIGTGRIIRALRKLSGYPDP